MPSSDNSLIEVGITEVGPWARIFSGGAPPEPIFGTNYRRLSPVTLVRRFLAGFGITLVNAEVWEESLPFLYPEGYQYPVETPNARILCFFFECKRGWCGC